MRISMRSKAVVGFKNLSQLDDFALQAARGLAARQPRCDLTIPELGNITPALADSTAIYHVATGQTYGVTLQQLQTLIGGGGGGGFNGVLPSTTNANALTVYNYLFYGALPTPGSAALNDDECHNGNGSGGTSRRLPFYSSWKLPDRSSQLHDARPERNSRSSLHDRRRRSWWAGPPVRRNWKWNAL
jgi:hypothetical protein